MLRIIEYVEQPEKWISHNNFFMEVQPQTTKLVHKCAVRE